MRFELDNLPQPNWFWHGEQVLALLDTYRPTVCVELGTWRGGSAIAVARLVSQWGGRVTAIDVWEWENKDEDITKDECARNVERAGLSDVVHLLQLRTDTAARLWRVPIDYLYVDADHTEDGCYSDLSLWWPHLKIGGLIAGDDYGDPRWGATGAWDRFERESQQTFSRTSTPGFSDSRLIWGVKQ